MLIQIKINRSNADKLHDILNITETYMLEIKIQE